MMDDMTISSAFAVDRPTASTPMRNTIIRICASTPCEPAMMLHIYGMTSSVSELVRSGMAASATRPMSIVPPQTMIWRKGARNAIWRWSFRPAL